MPEISLILAGFGDAFTLINLAFVVMGVAAGQMVGAIPGIGPIMAMAIAIPSAGALWLKRPLREWRRAAHRVHSVRGRAASLHELVDGKVARF